MSLAKVAPDVPAVFQSEQVSDLATIYEPYTYLSIWNRTLNQGLNSDIAALMAHYSQFAFRAVLKPKEVRTWLRTVLKQHEFNVLEEDIARICDIYADLFDLRHIGLRLELLDKTMCPRFHVDKLMCRLITTYKGATTQWLTEDNVDREKLGIGAQGLPDNLSGIYHNESTICEAQCGDVLLMKGQGWQNNELGGLVHRSPDANRDNRRLLLSIDFAED